MGKKRFPHPHAATQSVGTIHIKTFIDAIIEACVVASILKRPSWQPLSAKDLHESRYPQTTLTLPMRQHFPPTRLAWPPDPTILSSTEGGRQLKQLVSTWTLLNPKQKGTAPPRFRNHHSETTIRKPPW
jgi:hypothetical protein